MREKWAHRQEEATRDRERCCIRPETARLEGTLEQMNAAEACLKKGCDSDPWRMTQVYINTKQQPVTGLQERLHVGDSSINESKHRLLPRLTGLLPF